VNCSKISPLGYTCVTLQSQIQERTQKRAESAASGRRRWTAAFAAYAVSKVRRYTAALRRAALFISLVSLAFSGVSLYETVLRQPRLTIFTGCNWQYGRGPGSFDEYFVIPVTVANDGARGGTVLAIELTVDKGGRSKDYAGNFTVAGADDKRQLFAPLAIAGRAAATASIVFTQRTPAGPPLFGEPGSYGAALKLRTAVGISYGFVDQLFASPPPEAHLKPLLQRLDIAAVLGGERASFDACQLDHPDLPAVQAK
jgi:hypothetical protein